MSRTKTHHLGFDHSGLGITRKAQDGWKVDRVEGLTVPEYKLDTACSAFNQRNHQHSQLLPVAWCCPCGSKDVQASESNSEVGPVVDEDSSRDWRALTSLRPFTRRKNQCQSRSTKKLPVLRGRTYLQFTRQGAISRSCGYLRELPHAPVLPYAYARLR